MNHLVPEQMFSTETEKAQGISAVKALAIASQQGQKIWTITQSNLDLALSRINLGADAENDIRNAVYAGKIATAHEARINFNGWVGEGYTLIDPNTGAGGYMISGGGNGAIFVMLGLAGLLMVGIGLLAFGFVGIALAAPLIFAAIAISLANLFRGLSLLSDSLGFSELTEAKLCNLATYSYTAGLFALLGRIPILGRLLNNMWAAFVAGAGATVFLTPVCT
ncbi:hypothetical protein [Cellvibrio sp. KY-GH-1]|uniref:hypothetical protein n=1 Tax=Cellvibrio sp. KY-GH-1 TaxID=2303332 RepID=UPI001248580F|nr:hypothetical protein [Cellvibrio sp. KY-GH-1]